LPKAVIVLGILHTALAARFAVFIFFAGGRSAAIARRHIFVLIFIT
jgi:hypothetical protein